MALDQKGKDVESIRMFLGILLQETDLRVEVLLKLQLLFEGLDAILTIHPPQHLILQLLSDIGQTGVQLKKTKKQNQGPIEDTRWYKVQNHAESVTFMYI